MRIAIATVGTTGDVRPFATLARRLVERRHDVTAISWPVHRAALGQAGVRVEVAGSHADPARIAAVAADAARRGPLEQVAVLRDFHLADGESHYRRLLELLPGHDIVLLHGIHALAHAAVLDLRLPWATVVFDPVLLPTASAPPPGMPNLGPGNRLLWAMLDRMLARAGRPLDELLQRAGSAQRGLPLFRARSPFLHLVACSPAIMRVPPDLPPGTHVTGAWLDRSAAPELPPQLEAFLADGAPPVAMTFGSMAGIAEAGLDAAVEAVLRGGRRVVLQGAPGATSPNLLRIGAVDHRSLFPRTSLVVHHGGAGTTHAAVAAAVPSVVVAHVGDQRYWADRLHQLGVAPTPLLARGLTADALVQAVLAAAADPALSDAAGALAERVRREDGVAVTTSLIERLA
jgi:sterol 3beta-glucosyltransferase/vancomycin aglycone glucosyltransferase